MWGWRSRPRGPEGCRHKKWVPSILGPKVSRPQSRHPSGRDLERHESIRYHICVPTTIWEYNHGSYGDVITRSFIQGRETTNIIVTVLKDLDGDDDDSRKMQESGLLPRPVSQVLELIECRDLPTPVGRRQDLCYEKKNTGTREGEWTTVRRTGRGTGRWLTTPGGKEDTKVFLNTQLKLFTTLCRNRYLSGTFLRLYK